MSRVWRRLTQVPVRWRQRAAYGAVVVAFALGMWRVEGVANDAQAAAEEAQATATALAAYILANQQAECEGVNVNRDDLRHAFADVLTQNLVEAAQTPPDPARVEAYRTGLLEDLETEFGAKAWDSVTRTCVDVPVIP